MANYFAIKSGNWDDTTVWDSGIIPTSADTVFTNGYIVTVNADVDVDQLRNGSNYGQLANMCIPVMTNNTSPSGVASASLNNPLAYLAFDGNPSTYYDAGANSPFTLTYQFDTPKIIKRFRIVSVYQAAPNAFSVQASDDPTFSTFATIGSGSMPSVSNNIYISAVLANTTPYLYYRLNVTTNVLNGTTPRVYSFDLTESLSAFTNGSGATLTTLLSTGGYYKVDTLPTLPSTRTILVRNTTSGIVNTGGSVNVFQINAPSGTININHSTLGNVVGGSGLVASYYNIIANTTAACTININGNLFGDTAGGGANRSNAAFGIFGGVTANVIGTLTAGFSYNDGNAAFGSSAIVVGSGSGNAILNVTGNLFGQSTAIGNPGSDVIFLVGNNATLNIVGIITANLYYGIRTWTNYTGNINITTGTVTASSTAMGIFNQGSGTVTLSSPIINTNNFVGVYSTKVRFYSTAQVQWLFQNSAGGNTVLYSTGASLGMPLTTNVRNGITYGANNELVGVLIIPTVNNVRTGVLTDNTIGTGEITAEDFLNAIQSSSNISAIRLKNVSTVETTGDQLAAFTS